VPDGSVPGGRLSGLAAAADVASAAVIGVVLLLVSATFRDYGITWDETWHMVYGDYVVDWTLSLGHDRSALTYRVDYMYGGGFDALGAIARRLSPWPGHVTMHLFGGLIGVLGLWGSWRLARRLGGPLAGLAAVVLLATTPVWYGHMFSNPKDLPFAVGYVWSMLYLVEVVAALPRPPRRAWAKLAVVAGLAMSVRIAGLLILCYLIAAVFVFAALRGRSVHQADTGVRTFGRLMKSVGKTILGAWAVMLVFWPWAQIDPIRRPFIALGRMSRFTIHERTMPFAGEQMRTTEPRWDYMLHYFGLKLPLLVVLLALCGLAMTLWSLTPARRRNWQLARVLAIGTLALATVFPWLYAVAAGSVVYDGLRHFLFLVPIVVVIAALAAVELGRRLRVRHRAAPWVVALVLAAGAGRIVPTMIRLHPHEYIYFNEVIGGVAGAYGKYDTDYYGNSYKEGFETLYEQLWRDDPDRYLDAIWMLDGCIPDFIAREYMEPGFLWHEKHQRYRSPDFYLGYTRGDCHLRRVRRPVYFQVEREGIPLNVVRDLRADPDAAPPESPLKVREPKKKKKAKKPVAKPAKRPRSKGRSRPARVEPSPTAPPAPTP
jgi:hypothetical protein